MSRPKVFVRDRMRLLILQSGMAVALAATIWLLPTQAAAQALYGSVTGAIADGTGAAVPGASVTIKNEDTGLEFSAVTDGTGTYTIRNVAGGTYTLKASLQGFKEFVQTGIPITAGGIVRINGRLEIGALSESVTVTTEATVLKTDKADVSVDLRPEDVVNLPLNQYRNYQYLMNLVPGATPPQFQNAQTDTPARALTTNINGTNRNNNVTRIDGAASINVWLPHHAGYIAPVETIENVNISTNSFDAAQGMTGGAATAVVTKSGTNTLKGSAFYFRNQDEFNARRGYFDPSKVDASTAIMGGTVGGPVRRNRLFYFGSWERNAERQGIFNTYTVPTAKMRNGDFSEVLAASPNFRIYDPATGTSTGAGRTFFEGAVIPASRISEISKKIQTSYPAPNNPGTNNGLQNNLFLPRSPTADRDNYDVKVNWNRTSAHQIWGKFSMMQASVFDLFYLGLDGAGGGDTTTSVYTVGQTWTLSPTLLLDGSVGANVMQQSMTGPDYGTNIGLDVWGIPGLNSSGATGPGSADLERYSGMPVISPGLSGLGNNSTWTPVWRDERSYTLSTNLTKVAGRHELRTGFDFVRLRLTHWQPEVGNPRGELTFGGGITGTPGYTSQQLEQLRRVPARRDEQLLQERAVRGAERPRKPVRPVCGRSLAGQREAHAEPWPPLRVLPADVPSGSRHRAARHQHVQRAARRPRWQPDGSGHRRQQDALRAARRRRVPARRADGVPRRLRQDVHPVALVAPVAWTVPADDRLQRRRPDQLHPLRQCGQRHPRRAQPGHRERQRSAPADRGHDVA